jgi:hypothetical protein
MQRSKDSVSAPACSNVSSATVLREIVITVGWVGGSILYTQVSTWLQEKLGDSGGREIGLILLIDHLDEVA